MEPNGAIVGWLDGASGAPHGFRTLHHLDCRSADEIIATELPDWGQRITLQP
jgi:hypothetical protein